MTDAEQLTWGALSLRTPTGLEGKERGDVTFTTYIWGLGRGWRESGTGEGRASPAPPTPKSLEAPPSARDGGSLRRGAELSVFGRGAAEWGQGEGASAFLVRVEEGGEVEEGRGRGNPHNPEAVTLRRQGLPTKRPLLGLGRPLGTRRKTLWGWA